jgi:hypothetical protein
MSSLRRTSITMCLRGYVIRNCVAPRAPTRHGAGTSPRGLGHLLERARFLEQVGGAGDNLQILRGGQQLPGLAIQVDDQLVAATDHEERRGLHAPQELGREVWPSAARDDGTHGSRPFRRRDQRGRRTGAGSEESHRPLSRRRLVGQPVHDSGHTSGEQRNVEPKLPGE